MNNPSTMFSSVTGEWGTPQAIFDALDREFHFTVDLAANALNHKTENYFSQGSSLFDSYTKLKREVCWINPVYGNSHVYCAPTCTSKKCTARGWHTAVGLPGISRFLDVVSELHHADNTVVALLPARTDTAYWHDQVMRCADEIRLVRGRISFEVSKYSYTIDPAQWPHANDGLPIVNPAKLPYTLEDVGACDPAPFPSAIAIFRPRPSNGHLGPKFSSVSF